MFASINDVMEMMQLNLDGADGTVSALVQFAHKRNTPVSCIGCRAVGCCMQQVVCFLGEALWIARHYPTPKDRRAADIALGLEQEATDRTVHFRQAKRCVFLADDNSCSIYHARPGACRRYFVVSKPELCMPTNTKKVSVLNTIDIDKMWIQSMADIQLNFVGYIEPFIMGALPRMVALASEVLEMSTGREMRRFLRNQQWMGFDKPMAEIDPDLLKAYGQTIPS